MKILCGTVRGMPHTSTTRPLHVAPLLSAIAAQAPAADASRSVAPEVIAALQANPVMRMSASREIGGLEASMVEIGRELEAVALPEGGR